ncbi:MAG: hypothetical protein PVJ08_08685 [Dehalococcoidia bacterium]|jgi:hypothetical protein
MSGKSRRRGRRLSRSQRKRVAPVVQSAAPVSKATPAATSAPAVAKAPAAKAAVQSAPSNVSGELKRIGMVGGLMVALLIAAYFVLPLILD